MSDTEIIKQKIEHAKDEFGVITQTGLHDQLGSMTTADWRLAAAVYSKGATTPDGFFIEDDATGKVTIHNDLTQAHRIADTPVPLSSFLRKEAWKIGATLVGGAGYGISLYGALNQSSRIIDVLFENDPLEGYGVVGVGLALSGAMVGGGAFLLHDILDNSKRQSVAKEDIRNAAELSVERR